MSKRKQKVQKFVPHLFVNYISPVRWTETVEKMAKDGVEVLVEIGPGKVLNGLTKRIVAELQATISKRCGIIRCC